MTHCLWPASAFTQQHPSARYSGVGAAIHWGCSVFWGVLFLALRGKHAGISRAVGAAAATAAIAYVVDLTWKMGQTHVNRWTDDLLHRIQKGQIDPSFVITHTVPLNEGPGMYKTFRDKEDGCIKVVLKP